VGGNFEGQRRRRVWNKLFSDEGQSFPPRKGNIENGVRETLALSKGYFASTAFSAKHPFSLPFKVSPTPKRRGEVCNSSYR